MTFLEYFGSKLSTTHREWAPKHKPFDTAGNFRAGEGISDIKGIAKSRQHDARCHPKVEHLRTGVKTMEMLSDADVTQICSMYGITDLDREHPKKLSNMAITIRFEPQRQCFILIKNE